MKYGPLVAAVDQGTSSSRVLIFAGSTGELLTYHQTEIKQIYPKDGWVEEDPYEILNSVKLCLNKAVDNLKELGIDPTDIKAVGITNQRETTVVWDKLSGKPLYNAIVWLDTRTSETVRKLVENAPRQDADCLRPRCGLPISTYFSAVKMRWLLDNCKEVKEAVHEGRCLFGNVDALATVEFNGRCNWGETLHRRHECKSHYAHEYSFTQVGPTTMQFLRHSYGYSARDSQFLGNLWTSSRNFAQRSSNFRDSRRPTGRSCQTDVLQGRTSQKHIRYRVLLAVQHWS